MGYAGGTSDNPTYHALGGHAETIEMDFDPSAISYEQLLDIFWNSHDPESRSWSSQYRSAIFYHNEEQKKQALASMEREESRRHRKIYTEIVKADRFNRAEDYHQKYYLKQRPELVRKIQSLQPGESIVDSTVAARINGFLAGNATCASTRAEVGELLPQGADKGLPDMICEAH